MRRNPFYVTPKGTAHPVTTQEMVVHHAQKTIPRAVERDALLEVHSDEPLPPGYEIRVEMRSGNRNYCVFYMGRDTGKYGTSEAKAKEIVSRMKDGEVAVQARRFRDMAKSNPRAQQARRNFVGTGTVVALAVAPFAAKMVHQLVSARADAWRELTSYPQKVAYLKKAFPKDSAPQDMLKHKAQAERLVAYIDHLVGSGALDTAGEGAAAGISAVGTARMNSLFTDEMLSELGVKPEDIDVSAPEPSRSATGSMFAKGMGAKRGTCPYTGKQLMNQKLAKPVTLGGMRIDGAPFGHWSIQKMNQDDLMKLLTKMRVTLTPLDTEYKPPEKKIRSSKSRGEEVTRPPVTLRIKVDTSDYDTRDNPAALPLGYTIVEKPGSGPNDKSQFHVMLKGQPTGKYGMTYDRAVHFAELHASGYVHPFSKEGRARAKSAKAR